MNTIYIRGKAVRVARGAVIAGAAATALRSQKVLIIAALALCAILLAPSATVAHAAPPEVTAPEDPVLSPLYIVIASPNPVYMLPGETTKTIELTWSVTPPAWAHLTVVVSWSNATVLDVPVSSPPAEGTVPLTVTYDKYRTYTAQLKEAFTEKPLGAPLSIPIVAATV